MASGDSGPGQSSQDFSVQVPQDSTGPNSLLFRDSQPRDSSGALPFAEKLPVGVKDFDALIVPIRDVDPALSVDHQVVRQSEFPGTLTSFAPLQQILSVARVLHNPSTAVAVGDVDIAIGGEGNVGRQVERVR